MTFQQVIGMTFDEFVKDMRDKLRPWDAGPHPYRSELEQARWYLGYLKAQRDREAQERERMGDADSPLTEEEFLAELPAM